MLRNSFRFCKVERLSTYWRRLISSRSTTLLISFFVVVAGVLVSGCATGNFRWYSPPGAENSRTSSQYTGESVYADKFLLRSQLATDDPLLIEIDNSVQIHASDLMSRFETSYLLDSKGGFLAWNQVADTLDSYLVDTLVSLAADTFDLRQDSASWGDYVLVRESLLGKKFLEEVVYAQTKVDSLEADSFYYARPDIFTYFPQVDLAHIILSKDGYRTGSDSLAYIQMPDDELDSLILRRLRYLKGEITDSLKFQEMADKYSQDRRTGDHGGRLGWVEQYNLHPEIEDVLYGGKVGLNEVIGPLVSRDGVHLFYIYDRHLKGIPPLDADRYRQAYNYVLGGRAKVVYTRVRDSLRNERPTTFIDSALQLSRDEADPRTPVAWAAGLDTLRFSTLDRALVILRAKLPANQSFSINQLRSVAQGQIDKRLTLRMSREIGLDNNPEFKKIEAAEYHNFARAAVRRKSRDPKYIPTEKEIGNYYREHQSEYVVNKPVRIQQIVFQDSLQAEFVRSLAESGEDFLALADVYYPGDTAIRRDAADLGYIGPLDFESNIFSIAERAFPGDVTPPIKTQYGFHIVKVIDVKRRTTLDENRSAIMKILIKLHDTNVKSSWNDSIRAGRKISVMPVRYRGLVMGPRENRSYLPEDILPEGLQLNSVQSSQP